MSDVVDSATRSKMMASIRGKNTRPEIIIRRALHSRGYRYRLHVRDLPGSPDLVFRTNKALIFINGCFWHQHRCQYFKWPKTRKDFWRKKLAGNARRDKQILDYYGGTRWRVAVVWECAIRRHIKSEGIILDRIEKWLTGNRKFLEIS